MRVPIVCAPEPSSLQLSGGITSGGWIQVGLLRYRPLHTQALRPQHTTLQKQSCGRRNRPGRLIRHGHLLAGALRTQRQLGKPHRTKLLLLFPLSAADCCCAHNLLDRALPLPRAFCFSWRCCHDSLCLLLLPICCCSAPNRAPAILTSAVSARSLEAASLLVY